MKENDYTSEKEYCNDVDELRGRYPDIHKAYEQISKEQFHLFARKMMDYGKGNISVGTNDKIQRLKQLVLLNKDPKVKTESIIDTFQDLSIYGIISQIVSNGNWK